MRPETRDRLNFHSVPVRRTTAPVQLTIRSAAELVAEEITEQDNLLADRLLARGQSLTLLGAGGIGNNYMVRPLFGRSFMGSVAYRW